MSALNVLFVASEASPLIKTGGLADVCGALPEALRAEGLDVRLLLPAYRDARTRAGTLESVGTLTLRTPAVRVELLAGTLDNGVPFWLIDYPPAFDRPGNPYLDRRGLPWSDNAARFALLSRVAVEIAQGRAGLSWRPDLVHGHDWQAGLVPALLSLERAAPATVFTIHNLSYQGRFDRATFDALRLPPSLWSFNALEFHGDLSFIKGGLVFADSLTTVSPTYAREIQTPAFGYGLEGLLSHRSTELHGIMNGIDDRIWDPASDPFIAQPFDRDHLAARNANKLDLLREMGLPPSPSVPVIGMIGRLVSQKGVDLAIDALQRLSEVPLKFVLLGTGETDYEHALNELAALNRTRYAVHIGYHEELAHCIEAGADMFLMPSRYEPCGLNQMYSLRYGAVPIVHAVGGLADTIIDTNDETLRAKTANGFVFHEPSGAALANTVRRALTYYARKQSWKQIMHTGMSRDFSWRASAAQYLSLYRRVLQKRGAREGQPARV